MNQGVAPKINEVAFPFVLHRHLEVVFYLTLFTTSLSCKYHGRGNVWLDQLRNKVLGFGLGDEKPAA